MRKGEIGTICFTIFMIVLVICIALTGNLDDIGRWISQ